MTQRLTLSLEAGVHYPVNTAGKTMHVISAASIDVSFDGNQPFPFRSGIQMTIEQGWREFSILSETTQVVDILVISETDKYLDPTVQTSVGAQFLEYNNHGVAGSIGGVRKDLAAALTAANSFEDQFIKICNANPTRKSIRFQTGSNHNSGGAGTEYNVVSKIWRDAYINGGVVNGMIVAATANWQNPGSTRAISSMMRFDASDIVEIETTTELWAHTNYRGSDEATHTNFASQIHLIVGEFFQ